MTRESLDRFEALEAIRQGLKDMEEDGPMMPRMLSKGQGPNLVTALKITDAAPGDAQEYVD